MDPAWSFQMREEELLKLESATRDVGVPLLIARSYGLMGYLRVRGSAALNRHCCLESRCAFDSAPDADRINVAAKLGCQLCQSCMLVEASSSRDRFLRPQASRFGRFTMQISSPEHRVIESKPDSVVMDLRFHAPWPQLQALTEALDLTTLDDIEHKHVPYGAYICCIFMFTACCMSMRKA